MYTRQAFDELNYISWTNLEMKCLKVCSKVKNDLFYKLQKKTYFLTILNDKQFSIATCNW